MASSQAHAEFTHINLPCEFKLLIHNSDDCYVSSYGYEVFYYFDFRKSTFSSSIRVS